MKSFVEYCKDYITFGLPDCYGAEWYGADVAFYLTELDNNKGGMESEAVSKEYIKTWWDDCASFYEYYKNNYGAEDAAKLNVFENASRFMFIMVLEGIEYILSGVSIINENWNDELEITDDVIETILTEVDNFKSFDW